MTELLYNNDFAIPGSGPMEPADDWVLNTAQDGYRTTAVADGLPPTLSGNNFIIALHDTVINNSRIQQAGIPFIIGNSYILTFNCLIKTNVNNNDEITVFASSTITTLNTGIFDVWVPLAMPFNTALGLERIIWEALDADIRFVYLDDPSVLAPLICYSGESLVYAKVIETGEIKDVLAKDIDPAKHMVYDMQADTFIPIAANKKTGPTRRYALFTKDCISPGVPSSDFYVTKGHYILHNGQEIKAGKMEQAKTVKAPKNEAVYSICTEIRTVIKINNMAVFTYTLKNWDKYVAQLEQKIDNASTIKA